jgi:hypothetical protein
MKPWKVLLGLGAACAACCAIPLVAAAGGGALFGSALLARLEAFVPASLLLTAGTVAMVVAGLWWLRKRRASGLRLRGFVHEGDWACEQLRPHPSPALWTWGRWEKDWRTSSV